MDTTNDLIPVRFTLRHNSKLNEAGLSKLIGLLQKLDKNPHDAMALQEIRDDALYLSVAGSWDAFQRILDSPVVAANDIAAKTLGECEAVIERGQQTFFEVGYALGHIRDHDLYRSEFDSFESYCVARWGWKRQHAYRLICAAEVASDLGPVSVEQGLSPIGDRSRSASAQELETALPQPTNEAQVRPLAKLPRAERREAWREACTESGGQPTAEKVSEVVGRKVNKAKTANKRGKQPKGESTAQEDDFTVAVCDDKDAKAILRQHRNLVLLSLTRITELKPGHRKSLCSVIAKGSVPKMKKPLDPTSGLRTALERAWPDALKLSPKLPNREGWAC